MKIRPTFTEVVVLATFTAALGPAVAGVSAEEAAKLKSTLTPMGGERAGNKEGTIPAWDGSYPKAPAGYQSGDPRPNPWPGERPVLTITAANMAQHADKLNDGTQALLKKYPTFKVEVYPSHRTGVAPQYVYDNTFKNATRAKAVANGYGVEDAVGGVPFPLTRNPYEMILNHRLSWSYPDTQSRVRVFMMTADGRRVVASEGIQSFHVRYYDPDMTLEKFDGYLSYGKFQATGPSSKAGEAILAHEPVWAQLPRNIWQYLVGQRRVRKAPSIAYDTPDTVTSGIGLFDEAFMLFGPSEKHDLKLVGKRELYIPYNNTAAMSAKVDDLVTPNHLNPSQVRWELHRVWEIEATLKSGQRHVVPKRKYYLDEDTWQIVLLDGWDAKGDLWRVCYSLAPFLQDHGNLTVRMMWGAYDLQAGSYFLNMAPNELPMQQKSVKLLDSFFQPETLAAEGAR